MSWMTKHTKNLLGDMPIDDKASALNHTSFPVHQHPHSSIDPDAPGTPGQPGYEPPVKREDLDAQGQKLYDKLHFQDDFNKLQKINKTKPVVLNKKKKGTR